MPSIKEAFVSITEQFVSENKATIPIKISSLALLYNPYDRNGLILNDEIASYIDKCAFLVPKQIPILLLFCCPELSDTKKDAIKNLIRIHYSWECRELRKKWLQSIAILTSMLLVGGFLVVASSYIKNEIWNIVCAVVGILSISSVLRNWIPYMMECRKKLLSMLRIFQAKISFQTL